MRTLLIEFVERFDDAWLVGTRATRRMRTLLAELVERFDDA